MENLLLFLTEFLDAFPFFLLQYLPFYSKAKRRYGTIIGIIIAIVTTYSIGFVLLSRFSAMNLTLMFIYRLCMLLLLLLLTFVFLKRPYGKALFIFFAMMPVMQFSLVLAGFLSAKASFLPDVPYLNAVCYRILLSLILFPATYQLFTKRLIPAMDVQDDAIWNSAWPLPFTFTLANVVTLRTDYDLNGVAWQEVAIQLVILVGCTFSILFLIHMLEVSKEKLEALRKQEEAEQLLALQEDWYQALLKKNEMERKARHDMKHHLVLLDTYAESGNIKGLREYLETLGSIQGGQQELMISGNSAIDAVYAYYHAMAIKEGIAFDTTLRYPSELPFPGTDLCVLWGNLMENAIEGTRTAKGKRCIRIRGEIQCGAMLMIISNPYDGVHPKEAGQYLSRKRSYQSKGIGMGSIKTIIDRYHGMMEVNANETDFKVSVMMPLPHQN